METVLLIVLLIVAGGFLWFLVRELEREHQKHELAKKNMSFMESLSLTGLPIICFNNNGQTLNMVLDTGSNTCIVDSNILDNLDFTPGDSDTDGIIGVAGTIEESQAVILRMSYKNMNFDFECYANDISGTVSAVKQEYGVTIHGLLGTDFFSKYKYILDFNEMVAYSLRKN